LKAYRDDDPELLSDENLNDGLDPFRGIGPVPVHCGLEGCARVVSRWALPVRGLPPFGGLGPQRWPLRPGVPDPPVPEPRFSWGIGVGRAEGARLVHSSWGPKRREIRRDWNRDAQSWQPPPYEEWSVGIVLHEHDAEPVGTTGLVFLFTCPRGPCQEPYTLSI